VSGRALCVRTGVIGTDRPASTWRQPWRDVTAELELIGGSVFVNEKFTVARIVTEGRALLRSVAITEVEADPLGMAGGGVARAKPSRRMLKRGPPRNRRASSERPRVFPPVPHRPSQRALKYSGKVPAELCRPTSCSFRQKPSLV
jgi:hypothetical protein